MPFTLAHPAVVVPLYKAARWYTSLSALVIGSMAPDFVYFVPAGIPARLTHSLVGVILFCVPCGWIAFTIFHRFVKRPVIDLLPSIVARKLADTAGTVAVPFLTRWIIVISSLALGALTHIVWDAFTHGNTVVVKNVEVLQTMIASIGTYHLYLYKLLQHMSSIVGITALIGWIVAWVNADTKQVASVAHNRLTPACRAGITGTIATAAILGGLLNGVSVTSTSIENTLSEAVVGCIVGLAVSVIVYCVGWHIKSLLRARSE